MIDVRKVIAKCAAYAPDRVPVEDRSVEAAWTEHFSEYPYLTLDDALAAVTKFFKQTKIRPGLILPGDISEIAREIHQDAAMRRPDRTEHDGSNYGRIEHVTDEIFIEEDRHKDQETGFDMERYRFCWDGPIHQPFVGAWHDTKAAAIREGIDWCNRHAVRPDEDITQKPLYGVEHAPGEPCAAPGCPKPSTFREWCAMHYCLTNMGRMFYGSADIA